jgi:heterodisulfide reductase subunit C
MKQRTSKKLRLDKKTVSVLQTNEMAALRGGLAAITNPQSDSFIQCGSCHSNCPTNSTVCGPKTLAEF